tara:strand:- start:18036 stop:18449 length:414 start_codon:yes stop_codon:yes gene_type:complete
MVGGVIPDLVKEFKDSRQHKRDLETRKATANIALETEEVKGYLAQMKSIIKTQGKIINIPFVDAFNALLRPVTASMIMLLFMATAGMYVYVVLGQVFAGELAMEVAATIIWGSLVGDSIQAVLGFLFGYRSTKGRIK